MTWCHNAGSHYMCIQCRGPVRNPASYGIARHLLHPHNLFEMSNRLGITHSTQWCHAMQNWGKQLENSMGTTTEKHLPADETSRNHNLSYVNFTWIYIYIYLKIENLKLGMSQNVVRGSTSHTVLIIWHGIKRKSKIYYSQKYTLLDIYKSITFHKINRVELILETGSSLVEH